MRLPPKNVYFFQDSHRGLVMVDAAGVRHENVYPVKLFPLTDSCHWISILTHEGREILCLEHPEELPKESYKLLIESLVRVPVILTIHSIKRMLGGHEWHVTTDLGIATFSVETDENIRTLGQDCLVVIDRCNNRYLIPFVSHLDHSSRHILEHY